MSTFEQKWGSIGDDDGGDYDDPGYEDDRYDYEDDDMEEGVGYKATFEQEQSAAGQKNVATECMGSIELPNKNDKDFKKMKALLTPEDNFKYDVDKISQYLNDNENIDLDVKDRNEMCSLSSLIPNINFFNAAAYVIAYWVTNGGDEIDKKKWKKIYTHKKQVINVNFGGDYEKKANVYPADVIRYSRFLINAH